MSLPLVSHNLYEDRVRRGYDRLSVLIPLSSNVRSMHRNDSPVRRGTVSMLQSNTDVSWSYRGRFARRH